MYGGGVSRRTSRAGEKEMGSVSRTKKETRCLNFEGVSTERGREQKADH